MIAAASLAAAHALAQQAGRGQSDLPDAYVQRLRAFARLQELNAELLGHDSATAVLQRFCDLHGPRPGLEITARAEPGAARPAGEVERRELGVGPEAPLRYRRVALMCGELVLSTADNWYRPNCLSAEMNRLLDETDMPFGRVVGPLGYHRRTLTARMIAEPLAPGWEHEPPEAHAQPFQIPPQILEHRALLVTSDGVPISLVVETYTDTILSLQRTPAT